MARAELDQAKATGAVGSREPQRPLIIGRPDNLNLLDFLMSRHIPSHRGLIEDLGSIDIKHEPRNRLDAIIVPTSRTPKHIEESARVAQLAGVPLFYLCSGEASVSGVYNHLAERNIDTKVITAVQLPIDYSLPGLQLTTDSLPIPGYSKKKDIAVKRNLGLALSRMMGWQHVLFLDDDVHGLRQPQLNHMLGGFEQEDRHVVGWSYSDPKHEASSSSDNSSLVHAYRLVGGEVETFIGGGNTAIRVTDDTAFFPNIYNEDWFFFAAMMRHGKSAIARAGDLTQRPKDLFGDTKTPIGEEFGDTLGEGLFRALYFDRSLTHPFFSSERYWYDMDYRRKAFIRKLSEELRPFPGEAVERADASIKVSLSSHDDTWPQLLSNYINGWHQDLNTWKEWFDKLPYLADPTVALSYLNVIRSLT